MWKATRRDLARVALLNLVFIFVVAFSSQSVTDLGVHRATRGEFRRQDRDVVDLRFHGVDINAMLTRLSNLIKHLSNL